LFHIFIYKVIGNKSLLQNIRADSGLNQHLVQK